MTEQWKWIEGFVGFYKVSDHGRVLSVRRSIVNGTGGEWKTPKRLLKLRRHDAYGYLSVALCKNGSRVDRLVHHLVLEAFVGLCPEGMECRHLDGNPKNNHRTNLKWGTRQDNADDKAKHGTVADHRGEGNPRAKLTKAKVKRIRRMRAMTKLSLVEIGRAFGIAGSTVSNIVSKESWSWLK